MVHLLHVWNSVYGDVFVSFSLPSQEPTHPFEPGYRVVVKALHKHKSIDPPYEEPTTVTAVTRTVLIADSHSWIHASSVKKAAGGPHPLGQEDVASFGLCLQELCTDYSELSDRFFFYSMD